MLASLVIRALCHKIRKNVRMRKITISNWNHDFQMNFELKFSIQISFEFLLQMIKTNYEKFTLDFIIISICLTKGWNLNQVLLSKKNVSKTFLKFVILSKNFNFFECIFHIVDHEESENQGPEIKEQILESRHRLYLNFIDRIPRHSLDIPKS